MSDQANTAMPHIIERWAEYVELEVSLSFSQPDLTITLTKTYLLQNEHTWVILLEKRNSSKLSDTDAFSSNSMQLLGTRNTHVLAMGGKAGQEKIVSTNIEMKIYVAWSACPCRVVKTSWMRLRKRSQKGRRVSVLLDWNQVSQFPHLCFYFFLMLSNTLKYHCEVYVVKCIFDLEQKVANYFNLLEKNQN